MKISIIVAASENNVIGRDGDLPWRLKSDLRRLRELTRGHTVIVGRKTHESIVHRLGKPLPDRRTIVLSRSPEYAAPECEVVTSWEEAVERAKDEDEVFVFGGAEVYRLALPHADRIYLTRVHAHISGDAFFPQFDPSEWKIIHQERHARDDENEFDYTFEVLARERAN